ncbi:MAG: 50S ribosomal protein L31 [Patescibacteria group bacterium]|nr:50S ribosomal protein L31 [Patescibacteria group bacterium]
MKKDIHPKYFPGATVTCACGKTFKIGGTLEKAEIEICSSCHPFYTGQEKLLDTAGRVEKFKAKRAKAEASSKKVRKVRVKKAAAEKTVKPKAKAKTATKRKTAKK